MLKTISDFFNAKLESIPDDSFIEGNPEINTSGQTINNFRKTLLYLECNLFDTIEIKQFEGGMKNIFSFAATSPLPRFVSPRTVRLGQCLN